MSEGIEQPVYRIVRHSPGVLHMYRDDEHIDSDTESDEDSREDIERYGTLVAWDEDYTSVERWDAVETDPPWRTLIAVSFRYVTWQFEDVTCWDEIDSAGWVARHIEAVGPNLTYTAATSLTEALAARDHGGLDAVRAYERRYGVHPEVATPAETLAGLARINGREFIERWSAARASLDT
ncbi:hypothetical protein [Nocardia sp. NPDC051832]|uniref:hypothetical protein n=1 Tax=Nocardia sp. NPDC051832 TaxID=3155673 RepID=UPI0034412F05